ncbi:PREDICTED: RPM1-interacting protein 4-like [Tarenaya hassleriana]|uniref:RPM1-interacting protein 4-like n=1 Tax=Tarenaya hassleriana TaxID=28532 RepID=UPI00053C14F5|nr:PREDICTED: RPM1-interacting protein 4-like [Tarenaya hassleriana]
MANRAHVPRFGEWDKQTDAPFTIVFDNARTKKKNLYDPKENPELSSNQGSPPRPPRTPNPRRPEPANQIPKQRSQGHGNSRGEEDFRRSVPSPAHSDKNTRVRPQAHPREPYNNHPYGGRVINQAEPNRRPPPQPQPQPQQGNPRAIPNVRGQKYKPRAIPPFPGQGGNSNFDHMSYTHIFDQVREERNVQEGERRPIGGGNAPVKHHNQSSPESPKGCCFPWSRKGKY